LIKKYNDKISKIFGSFKGTLKETILLEDYEEQGVISMSALKECFETLDIDIDNDLFEYIIFVMYQKS